MDFELSDDQVALRDAARDLLDGASAPAQVRRVVDAGGGLDRDLWQAMVEQGWTALAVPEALGGLGLGFVEVAVLLEQVGAHVAPAPFLQQVVALEALVRAVGPDAAAGEPVEHRGRDDVALRSWIDRLVAGDAIATVAATPVAAQPTSGGWRLTGVTEPAVYAPSADVAVVRGRDVTDPTGDGVNVGDEVLFLVDLSDSGEARPAREPAMDRTREVGWLRFEHTAAVPLGGRSSSEAFVDAGAVAMSAELLGASDRALALAVDYANEREQFGRPIGSFQAVKHRCADMLVDVEGMRSTAYYAAWCLAAGDDDRSVAASTAKTWCSDAAKRVMASALQVHGGIGFTWECDVHLFLKRAQLDERSFGDATHHRERLAGLLRARIESGASVI